MTNTLSLHVIKTRTKSKVIIISSTETPTLTQKSTRNKINSLKETKCHDLNLKHDDYYSRAWLDLRCCDTGVEAG